MKKSAISRILILALALALMVSMAFMVSASAEEEAQGEALEIISQNVSYEGQTHLFYAVSYENVESPEEITLDVSWTDSEGEHAVTVTESEAEVVEGKNCRIFKTPGVDAKNFTQQFAVVAKTASGTESALKTFSVTEYCNLWITYVAYNEFMGTANADMAKLAKACEATLQYGSAIQELLGYYPNDNTADNPANYAYVKALDGSVNGANSAHVIRGTEVTLAYTGALEDGKGVTSWNVYYADGTVDVVAANGKFAPKANCIAEAVIDAILPEFVAGDGYYYAEDNSGIRFDYSDDSQLNKMEWSGKPGFNAADQSTASATLAIVDGQLVFDKNDGETGYEEYIFWYLSSTSYGRGYDAGEDVVFESDIKFNTTRESGEIAKYSIRGAGFWFNIGVYINDGKINIGGAGSLSTDTWYNIRLVCTPDKETGKVTARLYVNGSDQGVVGTSITSTTDGNIGKAHFYLNKNEAGSATMDNVYFGYVLPRGTGAYYNDAENYSNLVRFDFENGVAQSLWEKNGVCESVIVDGANKFMNLDNGASSTTEYIIFNSEGSSAGENNTFVLETDIKVTGPWNTFPTWLFAAFGYRIQVGSDVWPNTALYFPSKGACMYVNDWYNLRFELTKTDVEGQFLLSVYLNGVLTVDSVSYTGSSYDSTRTLLSMPGSQNGDATLYFDNVAIGYVNK